MRKYKNQLEQINAEFCDLPFLKKYPVLRTTNLTPLQINLIELVLSFESNKQEFQMAYSNIAYRIGCGADSIRPNVSKLKKMELITTNQVFKKNVGGSKTFITVNMDALATYIKSFQQEQQPVSQDGESTEPSTQPVKEVKATPHMLKVVTTTPTTKTDMDALVLTMFFNGDKDKIKLVGNNNPQPKAVTPIQQVPVKKNKPKKVQPKVDISDVPHGTLRALSLYLQERVNVSGIPYDIKDMVSETGQDKENIQKCLTLFKQQDMIFVKKISDDWVITFNINKCRATLGWSTPKAA